MSHPLHDKAVGFAKNYVTSERELFCVLVEIVEKLIFPKLQYSCLADYLEKGLKLSESQAGYYRRVVTKAIAFPLLRNAVAEGTISLSQARRICGAMEFETQEYWIEAATRLKQKELERLVAEKHPRLQVKEGFSPIDKEHSEMRVVVTRAQEEKVERVQDLLSQKKNQTATLQDTVDAMASFYLEENDPVNLARKQSSRTKAKASVIRPGSHRIESFLRHLVHERDGFRCTEKDKEGNRCEAERWLHLHHELPISRGGTNSLNNLRTICSAHHRMAHQHGNYRQATR